MKKVAVILSGCGVFDGAEIHESVLTLYFLAKHGASVSCFAPDKLQHHVINHLTGDEMENESRNVLVESARIARGDVAPLNGLNADDFDVLVLPGGFGAAKNLCDFAIKGPDMKLDAEVKSVCQAFAQQGKPAAYACIAPAMMVDIYGEGVKLTIGSDQETADALAQMGAKHQTCSVQEVVVDDTHKVVSTPAYMLADNILEAASSIENMVDAVLNMA